MLEKYEDQFFNVVNAKHGLFTLRRKHVITQELETAINATNDEDAKEILYRHMRDHGTVDTLKEYCKVLIEAYAFQKMQILGKAMMAELEQGGWLESCHLWYVCVRGCGL